MRVDGFEKVPISHIETDEIEEPKEKVEDSSEIFFEAACLNKVGKSEYHVILGKDVIRWAKSVGLVEIPAIVKEVDQEKASLLSEKLKHYEQLDSPSREMTIIGEMSEVFDKVELKEVFPESLVDLHFHYQGEKVEIEDSEDEDDSNPIENNYQEEEVVPTEINWDNKSQKEQIELVRKITEGSSFGEKVHKWAITFLSEETPYQTPDDVLGGEADVLPRAEEES